MKVQIFLLAILLASAVSQVARAQTRLEWKLKKGDRFYVETVTTKKGTVTAGGKTTAVESVNTIVVSFTVLDKTADGAVLEEEIELVRHRPSSGATAFTKSALKALVEPRFNAQGVKEMKGATFRIVLQPNGKLTLGGYDDVLARMVRKSKAERAAVKEAMPEASWKGFVDDIFGVVPPRPVKKNDAWDRPVSVDMGRLGTFGGQYHYDLQETTGANAKLGLTGDLNHSAPRKTDGLPFQITASSIAAKSARGAAIFDIERGRLKQLTLEFHFKGSFTVAVGGKETALDVDQTQTVKTRVLDQNPLVP